ncbi:nuclear receptor coactivator 5 isoform X2 [Hyalella azteca]|uniref:Nuclear receptor coactivator 5 isoform X2 n=1 Tax=Hyalella azteca TaxID=294128 RepID=A0A8B7PPF7_HYAAZ|nr:nuclear receptor coactivator 5 isoform X2 [Hyalella azteca]
MSRRENMGSKRGRNDDWSHSRSRSPAGRRSPGGHGGSSETTTDPRTLDARIFIGSLVPEVTQEMLKSYFSKYGDVKGVMITKRKFGFVQFSSEHESAKCLADGPNVLIDGHRIDVKPAKIRYGGPGGGDDDGPRDGGRRGRDRPMRGGGRGGGDAPPARRQDFEDGRRDSYYDSYYKSEAGNDRRAGSAPGRERPASYASDYPDYYREYYDRYYRDPAPAGLAPREYPAATPAAYPPAGPGAAAPGAALPVLDPLDPGRPNDCEIVVPDKMQRAYAESIEVELKRCGLLVDILFPPGDVSSSRVLADLAGRRCLYAVFVTPENEKHRSLTLNILHGTPQEHRNMPVDDALVLVQRDFEAYVRLARRRNSREIVPSDIRNLMLDLLEARSLSMGDLDKLIKYLKERQNILVDDQIEQKRESAGSRAALEAPRSSQPITYPGYNYASSSAYSGSATSGEYATSAVSGFASSARPGAGSTSASAGSTSLPVSTAAVSAAIAAVTYPGLSAAATQQPPPPQPTLAPRNPTVGGPPPSHAVQYPTGYMSGLLLHSQPPPSAVAAPSKPELQDRILSLIKSNSVNPVSSATSLPPVGVPPPVPAPVSVPPVMLQRNGSEALYALQQQQHQLKEKIPMGMPQPSPYLPAYAGWHQ